MKIRHKNRIERWPNTLPEKAIQAIFIVGPILGILLLIAGLCFIASGIWTALIMVLSGLVCLLEWIYALQTAMAEFTFTNSGVHVNYPLEKCRFYAWSEFQQVCVCYYSRATEMNGYPLICMVKKGEKRDNFGRWKTGSVFHYRNLLCVDYSEAQLQEIRSYCPYEVHDLRGKGNYRL